VVGLGGKTIRHNEVRVLLKIGYDGFAKDNTGIADRRRILFWAEKRGYKVVSPDTRDIDLLVLTSSSNLGFWSKRKFKTPVIIDVVDGLMSEQSAMADYVRGLTYWSLGRDSRAIPQRFSQSLIDFARRVNLVICSSKEQLDFWQTIGVKAVDILDFHTEIIPLPQHRKEVSQINFLWEGLPTTLNGFSQLSRIFDGEMKHKRKLKLITNPSAYKFLGRYRLIDPEKEVRKQLHLTQDEIEVWPWTVQNLTQQSSISHMGLIPIDVSKGYNHMKAENRLLILWRLSLPVLVSPLGSYLRVMDKAGIDLVCFSRDDWFRKSEMLLNDQDYYAEMVSKSRTYLDMNHTEKIVLNKWDQVLEMLFRL
jgi:hypothetical protein